MKKKESFITTAEMHLRKGEYEAAVECLTKALELDPFDERIYLLKNHAHDRANKASCVTHELIHKITIFENLGTQKRTSELLSRVLDPQIYESHLAEHLSPLTCIDMLDPQRYDNMARRGGFPQSFSVSNDLCSYIQLLEKDINDKTCNKTGSNWSKYGERAYVYMQLWAYDLAIDDYTRELEQYSKHMKSRYSSTGIVAAYFNLGLYDKALASLKSIDTSRGTTICKGLCLYKMGRFREAVYAFEECARHTAIGDGVIQIAKAREFKQANASSNASRLKKEVVSAYEKRDFDEALKKCYELYEINIDDPTSYLLYALIHVQLNNRERAIEYLQRFISRSQQNTTTANALLNELKSQRQRLDGFAFFSEPEIDSIAREATDAVIKGQSSIDSRFNGFPTFYEQGKLAETDRATLCQLIKKSLSQAAIMVQPQVALHRWFVINQLCLALWRFINPKDKKLMNLALRTSAPCGNNQPPINLAAEVNNAIIKAGKIIECLISQEFRNGLSPSEIEYPKIVKLLGTLHSEQGIKLTQQSLLPNQTEFDLRKLKTAIKEEEYQLVFNTANALINQGNKAWAYFYYRGLAQAGLGKQIEAIEDLEYALKLPETDGLKILTKLVKIRNVVGNRAKENALKALSNGNFSVAISEFTVVLNCLGSDGEMFCGRAKAYFEEGDFQRADEDFMAGLKLCSGHIEYTYYHAQCLLQLKKHTSVLALANKLLTLLNSNPASKIKIEQVHFIRAQAYETLGNIAAAQGDYEKAIQSSGGKLNEAVSALAKLKKMQNQQESAAMQRELEAKRAEELRRQQERVKPVEVPVKAPVKVPIKENPKLVKRALPENPKPVVVPPKPVVENDLAAQLLLLRTSRLKGIASASSLHTSYANLEKIALAEKSADFFKDRGDFYFTSAQTEKSLPRKNAMYSNAKKDYSQALEFNPFIEDVDQRILDIEDAMNPSASSQPKQPDTPQPTTAQPAQPNRANNTAFFAPQSSAGATPADRRNAEARTLSPEEEARVQEIKNRLAKQMGLDGMKK